jgi:hypothetical protein
LSRGGPGLIGELIPAVGAHGGPPGKILGALKAMLKLHGEHGPDYTGPGRFRKSLRRPLPDAPSRQRQPGQAAAGRGRGRGGEPHYQPRPTFAILSIRIGKDFPRGRQSEDALYSESVRPLSRSFKVHPRRMPRMFLRGGLL